MANAILVVGGTGNVGRLLVRELAGKGEAVKAAARRPDELRAIAGVQPVRLDVSDPATYDAALDGVDRVFVLSPAGVVAAHELLGPFVARAATRVGKIVTMTAAGVEADENIPLRRLELQVERSGVKWVQLRPNWFMDNFHTYWRAPIQQAGIIPVPAGDAKTAFIDTRDVAASAAAVLTTSAHDGRAFALTGPESLTYADAAEILSRAAGRSIRYESIDDETFKSNLLHGGVPADYAGLMVGLFQIVRAGWAAEVLPTVEQLTGRRPRTLTEYAAEHADAWKK